MKIRRLEFEAFLVVLAGFILGYLMKGTYVDPLTNEGFGLLFMLSPLMVVMGIWAMGKNKDPVYELGWSWSPRFLLLLICGVIMSIVLFMLPLIVDVIGDVMLVEKIGLLVPAIPGIILAGGVGIIYGIAEEVAWRGHFQKKFMEHRGFIASAFIIACIWFLWHVGTFLQERPSFFIFKFLQLLALSIIFGLFYLWSGSILVPSLMHAVYNIIAKLANTNIPSMAQPLSRVNLILVHLLIAAICYMVYLYLKNSNEAPAKASSS